MSACQHLHKLIHIIDPNSTGSQAANNNRYQDNHKNIHWHWASVDELQYRCTYVNFPANILTFLLVVKTYWVNTFAYKQYANEKV